MVLGGDPWELLPLVTHPCNLPLVEMASDNSVHKIRMASYIFLNGRLQILNAIRPASLISLPSSTTHFWIWCDSSRRQHADD